MEIFSLHEIRNISRRRKGTKKQMITVALLVKSDVKILSMDPREAISRRTIFRFRFNGTSIGFS